MRSDVAHSVGVFETIVSNDMTAILDGINIHRVYSTFWLCYHAEVAARRAIEPYFTDAENAVGGEIFLRHEAMCAVGDTIRVEAHVKEITQRKIVCEILAYSSLGRIASGRQTQILMSNSEIDTLMNQAEKSIKR